MDRLGSEWMFPELEVLMDKGKANRYITTMNIEFDLMNEYYHYPLVPVMLIRYCWPVATRIP